MSTKGPAKFSYPSVGKALNRLLDDNRELYIPDTGNTVKPHEEFMALWADRTAPLVLFGWSLGWLGWLVGGWVGGRVWVGGWGWVGGWVDWLFGGLVWSAGPSAGRLANWSVARLVG